MAGGYPVGAVHRRHGRILAAGRQQLARGLRIRRDRQCDFRPAGPVAAAGNIRPGWHTRRPDERRRADQCRAGTAGPRPCRWSARTRSRRASRQPSAVVSRPPRACHRIADARLFRAYHDVLLHPEMDAKDRHRHGFRAVGSGRRAGLGQCRRGVRRAGRQPAHSEIRGTLADHRRDDRCRSCWSPCSAAAIPISVNWPCSRVSRDFFTNGAIVGLYAIFAHAFPTGVRAGGTGFVIGVGRGGAALSPIVAGALFQAGSGLQTVALIMALGSALGALALMLLGPPKPLEA